jgi:60kDa lysophospholipase
MTDWIRIATEIELNYSFDAFVVLHGTDTMTYTSSALTFLLEDLGKTVVCVISFEVTANLSTSTL